MLVTRRIGGMWFPVRTRNRACDGAIDGGRRAGETLLALIPIKLLGIVLYWGCLTAPTPAGRETVSSQCLPPAPTPSSRRFVLSHSAAPSMDLFQSTVSRVSLPARHHLILMASRLRNATSELTPAAAKEATPRT